MRAGSFSALLHGCAGQMCLIPYDEVQLTNVGLAPGEAVTEVEQAILDFAIWTGRAGVCVEEVRFDTGMHAEDGDISGSYRYSDALVKIDVDSRDWSLVAHHEYCHALDYTFDLLDQESRPLFVDGAPGPSDPRERFAVRCGTGPAPLELATELEACHGIDVEARFVLAEAFLGDWDWRPSYSWGLMDVQPTEIDVDPPSHASSARAAADDDAIYVVYQSLQDDEVDFVVFVLPHDTREPVLSLVGPRRHESDLVAWHLVGGDGASPVLVVEGEPVEAWRIGPQELVPTWFPHVTDIANPVLAGERLWMRARQEDSADRALLVVDLETGDVQPWAPPPGLDGAESSFGSGAGRIAATWIDSGSSTPVLAVYDLASGAWAVHDWPYPLIPIAALPVGDAVLVRWGAESNGLVMGLGWFTSDGRWILDRDVCGSHRAMAGGALVSVPEGAAMVELGSLEAPPRPVVWRLGDPL